VQERLDSRVKSLAWSRSAESISFQHDHAQPDRRTSDGGRRPRRPTPDYYNIAVHDHGPALGLSGALR